jgi:hypothetical protein
MASINKGIFPIGDFEGEEMDPNIYVNTTFINKICDIDMDIK